MKMTGLLLCFNTVLLLNPQGLDCTPVGGWSLTGNMERFLGQLLWERSLILRKEIGTESTNPVRCKRGFGFSWSGHHRVWDPGDAPKLWLLNVVFSNWLLGKEVEKQGWLWHSGSPTWLWPWATTLLHKASRLPPLSVFSTFISLW